ncbi:MAG: hypothetical protein NZM31_00215 [Gemmatales bacterium]|nr:hypothetical protein [Gemmatales bacterium]MDW8385416.1 hypothetical protein [Gemmatales bacterium]
MTHRIAPKTIVSISLGLLVAFLVVSPASPSEANVESAIKAILAVGKEGKGATEAARALRELSRQEADVLPALLAAMDQASPEASNYLRAAVEAVADKAITQGKPLPVKQLEAFVQDHKHHPKARRLAYDLLLHVDPTLPERWLPGMLQDPSLELRRDAVAMALREAEAALASGDKDAARQKFEQAFRAARDRDQVDALAKQLKALGVSVDIAGHFGFIRDWLLVGPFDNSGGIGFAASYPPENSVDPKAEYVGKQNARLTWKPHTTADPYGVVDLNKAIGKHMGAVGYAYAVVESPEARPVEVRVGSNNAVKVWLNGQELISHEEYHHGNRMDQYIGSGMLKPGRNEVLIKICQNEQKEEWAQSWSFQLRLCDRVGTAVPVTVVKHPAERSAAGTAGEGR